MPYETRNSVLNPKKSSSTLRALRALRGNMISYPQFVFLSPRSTGMEFEGLSGRVIGCAIEVHRQLGPGLLESAYEQCLAHELAQTGIVFRRQDPRPVLYKGIELDCGFRIDLLVENQLILELKSVDELKGIHEAQLLTYMKLSDIKVGLLINFNVTKLKDGLKRLVL